MDNKLSWLNLSSTILLHREPPPTLSFSFLEIKTRSKTTKQKGNSNKKSNAVVVGRKFRNKKRRSATFAPPTPTTNHQTAILRNVFRNKACHHHHLTHPIPENPNPKSLPTPTPTPLLQKDNPTHYHRYNQSFPQLYKLSVTENLLLKQMGD